jgi:hypothetical protein
MRGEPLEIGSIIRNGRTDGVPPAAGAGQGAATTLQSTNIFRQRSGSRAVPEAAPQPAMAGDA